MTALLLDWGGAICSISVFSSTAIDSCLPHSEETLFVMSTANRPWFRELNRYHWFVFVVAALGWLFDTMDQQLFNLARLPACNELMNTTASEPRVRRVRRLRHLDLPDRLGHWRHDLRHHGRSYRTGQDDALDDSDLLAIHGPECDVDDGLGFRLLPLPNRPGGRRRVRRRRVAGGGSDAATARPFALGLLQALSAIGNLSAALISMFLGRTGEKGAVGLLAGAGCSSSARCPPCWPC